MFILVLFEVGTSACYEKNLLFLQSDAALKSHVCT